MKDMEGVHHKRGTKTMTVKELILNLEQFEDLEVLGAWEGIVNPIWAVTCEENKVLLYCDTFEVPLEEMPK